MVSVPPASIETAGGFLIVAEIIVPIPSVTFRQQAISLIFRLLPSGLTAKCSQ